MQPCSFGATAAGGCGYGIFSKSVQRCTLNENKKVPNKIWSSSLFDFSQDCMRMRKMETVLFCGEVGAANRCFVAIVISY